MFSYSVILVSDVQYSDSAIPYITQCSSQVSSLISFTYFTHPPHLSSGSHQFFIVKSLFLAFSLLLSFVHLFLKFHIWVKSYGISFSLTDLFHLVLCSLAPCCCKRQDFVLFYGWIIIHCKGSFYSWSLCQSSME